MNLVDRLLTIVITATITSAIWIVAGGSLIENATADSQRAITRPAEVAPSPSPSEGQDLDPEVAEEGEGNESLNTTTASTPDAAQARQLLIPVKNIRAADLTDTFSDARDGSARLHEALDIMAPRGTSVVAAAPGTIEKLHQSDAGGFMIYVRSQDRETIHFYAHLDEYAPGLQEGQKIRRGQRLGTVGSTGNASDEAPHLHFAILQTTSDAEWWEPANAINPYPLLAAR